MRGDYKLKAQAWSDLSEAYCDRDGRPLEGMLPMIELIQKLASSPYAKGLVARNSLSDVASGSNMKLLIAQAEANLWPGPRLEIVIDTSKRQFTLTFFEGGFRKEPWKRTAEAGEGFEVLERFLTKRARWFRKPVDIEAETPSPSSA